MRDFSDVKNMDMLWCHWDLVRFLGFNNNIDFNTKCIGVCHFCGDKQVVDLRIYLYKEDSKYIIQIYTSDTEFDILEFDSLDEALENLDMIPYGEYEKYRDRPSRVI